MSSPNGILSKSDKQFLYSQSPDVPDDVWQGDEGQKRYRIRNKIKAALDDFTLLQQLPRKEYELIFDDLGWNEEAREATDWEASEVAALMTEDTDEPVFVPGFGEQYEQVEAVLAFIYKACRLDPTVEFEALVESAINIGERDWGTLGPGSRYIDDVEVDITISYRDQPDTEEIKQKIARGETITRAEVGELAIKGELGDVELGPENLDLQGEYHPGGFPGLDRAAPKGWDEDLREVLLEEQIEKVDWEAARTPRDVWEQLEELEEDPWGNAMYGYRDEDDESRDGSTEP